MYANSHFNFYFYAIIKNDIYSLLYKNKKNDQIKSDFTSDIYLVALVKIPIFLTIRFQVKN